MNKSIDPRVTRTRRLLMDALTELIVEEGLKPLPFATSFQKRRLTAPRSISIFVTSKTY